MPRYCGNKEEWDISGELFERTSMGLSWIASCGAYSIFPRSMVECWKYWINQMSITGGRVLDGGFPGCWGRTLHQKERQGFETCCLNEWSKQKTQNTIKISLNKCQAGKGIVWRRWGAWLPSVLQLHHHTFQSLRKTKGHIRLFGPLCLW